MANNAQNQAGHSNPTQQMTNETFGVVNVKDLTTKEEDKPKPEDSLWYNKLTSWISIGAGVSLLLGISAFINKHLLYLIPLPPIIAAVSWYVRRLLRKVNLSQNDQLLK